MRLLTGPTTPFGRLVEVAAREAGVPLDVERIVVSTAEFLDGLNPLRLIPTLVADDGSPIHDSRVICRFLASRAPGAGLLPPDFDPVFETRFALILGAMDAGVARQGEVTRPEASRSADAVARLEARVRRGIERLERDVELFAGAAPRLDALGAAVLLDYVDFRISPDWRAAAPRLARFREMVSERPSMIATRFAAAPSA
jgi:glutathione S-transferase